MLIVTIGSLTVGANPVRRPNVLRNGLFANTDSETRVECDAEMPDNKAMHRSRLGPPVRSDQSSDRSAR